MGGIDSGWFQFLFGEVGSRALIVVGTRENLKVPAGMNLLGHCSDESKNRKLPRCPVQQQTSKIPADTS
jgi:hypothetical protein